MGITDSIQNLDVISFVILSLRKKRNCASQKIKTRAKAKRKRKVFIWGTTLVTISMEDMGMEVMAFLAMDLVVTDLMVTDLMVTGLMDTATSLHLHWIKVFPIYSLHILLDISTSLTIPTC